MDLDDEPHNRRPTMSTNRSDDTGGTDQTGIIHHPSRSGDLLVPDEGGAMNTNSQLLLSVEEAADVLRLGRTGTYELVMTGKIQSIKVGRRRLVVRSSLHDFVQTLLREQECR
jgi:excisionase family DNA binding protein